jgi:hypothetical protein
MLTLTAIVLFGGRHAEGYCCANDFDQAAGRVFEAVKRIIEATGFLRDAARVTAFQSYAERMIMRSAPLSDLRPALLSTA